MHNFYLEAYDLINKFIYGNTIVDGSYEDMVATFVATAAILFFIALPFITVFWACKKLVSLW